MRSPGDPSPLQTRSARKKRMESTSGTAISPLKSMTPSKTATAEKNKVRKATSAKAVVVDKVTSDNEEPLDSDDLDSDDAQDSDNGKLLINCFQFHTKIMFHVVSLELLQKVSFFSVMRSGSGSGRSRLLLRKWK